MPIIHAQPKQSRCEPSGPGVKPARDMKLFTPVIMGM